MSQSRFHPPVRVLRQHVGPLLRDTFAKWRRDNCVRLGASLSFYTILSIFPLILVILSVLGLVLHNSDAARDVILDQLARVTGGFRSEFIDTLDNVREARQSSGIIGIVTLLLGATWVFGELVSAFNIIWGLERPNGGGPMAFVRATSISFLMVLSVALLLLALMVINTILAAIGTQLELLPGGAWLWKATSTFATILILIGLFTLLFKYLPRTRIPWGDVLPGAILTAVLWNAMQSFIAAYISFSSYTSYGTIGAAMALVVWVYFSAQILFFGGEFTYVYANRYGSRRVK